MNSYKSARPIKINKNNSHISSSNDIRQNSQTNSRIHNLSYYNNQNEISFAKNEINIIKSLNHPNIVKYYTDFEEGQRLYIIMEYIQSYFCHQFFPI